MDKKLTEKECLEALLNEVRSFCFYKVDETLMMFHRQRMACIALEYFKLRDEKRHLAEQAKIEREARKHERRLNAKKTI